MKRERHILKWLLRACLGVSVSVSLPCVAQKGGAHAPQQQHSQSAPSYHPSQPSHPAQPHPAQAHPAQAGHAGDWLRHYKDLPPAEQERELQKDPGFRHLPPAQQQVLRQRLRHFSSLPPQEQLRVLNRMETWEHLTPEQKTQARQIFNQMRKLPPTRQVMVSRAVHDLRSMPPDQRDRIIDSPRFRGVFTDQEREMIRGASRLPLAPAEGGETP